MADLLHTRFPRLDRPTVHRQLQVNRASHFIQSAPDGVAPPPREASSEAAGTTCAGATVVVVHYPQAKVALNRLVGAGQVANAAHLPSYGARPEGASLTVNRDVV